VDERGIRLLEAMRAKRGYVLPTHEFLAAHDPDFLEGYDAFFSSAMGEDSPLPRKIREFVLMAADLCLGQAPNVVGSHAKRAMEDGATREEVLAVIEIATLAHAARSLSAGIPALRDHGGF
jgi:alkylhydroperoxidase/carboxymuconolactone decarboxylase family protein YurZ